MKMVSYVKSTMIKEYFDIYNEKRREYGERTCVLYENGAFYEIYQIDNEYEKIGNAFEIGKILNDMKYASKMIGKIDVNFVGFTTSSLDKFLPLLLSANYTVILVNQLEDNNNRGGSRGNLRRGVTRVYSPSLQPLDYNGGNLLCIMLRVEGVRCSNKRNACLMSKIVSSVCCVKNEYNDIEMMENIFECKLNDKHSMTLFLEELNGVVYRYFPREIQLRVIYDEICEVVCIEEYFKNNYENVAIKYLKREDIKMYKDEGYQNKFLREVYSHINFGLIEPIEYMNLCGYEITLMNLIYTIEFIGRHDISYIRNLNLPNMVSEDKHLILELNTVEQLNIIPQSFGGGVRKVESLFDVINFTKTVVGKRHLLSLLCKPFKNVGDINERYMITEEIGERVDEIGVILSGITDFEKLHRKMCLDVLNPYEFVKLNDNYVNIVRLLELMSDFVNLGDIKLSMDEMKELRGYMMDYNKKFNLDLMRKMDLNASKDEIVNYFNKNIIPELDEIQCKITMLEGKMEMLRVFYEEKINVNKVGQMIKLMYTENEGYSFSCTRIRYELLVKKLRESKDVCNFRVKQTSNMTKFYPEELLNVSMELLNYRELLNKKIRNNYLNVMSEYYKVYVGIFKKMRILVETIDVCYSNYKCKERYRYVRPEIVMKDEGFLDAKELRHPIIERLGKSYVPNDVILERGRSGMLLFGLNSSGKSSLLRAVGLCVVLAQCGLYVPCRGFKFSPFHTLISQVDLTDNLFSGKSSYITEMLGLKKILRSMGEYSLILCDEMCKGTEHISSISLVGSTLKRLVKTNSKFFFTTHLHQLKEDESIVSNKGIKICHLSVKIRNDDIIFERKLMDGNGSELYGLEVAKSILEDDMLIDDAFEIRNKLMNKSVGILGKKRSNYNRKKIIKKCEICGETRNLETDHIIPQCEADDEGFLTKVNYHKNEEYNLAILCKECHLKKTLGKIRINGYKDSTNGKFLDYEYIE